VLADHQVGGYCWDQDKSFQMYMYPPFEFRLILEVTGIEGELDIPNLILTLTVDYQVTGTDATDCRMAVYDKELNHIATKYLGPEEDGEVAKGYEGEVEFELQLAPDQMGTFRAVIFGTETAEYGQSNRDGQGKHGLQHGDTCTIWPTAYNVPGDDQDYDWIPEACAQDAASEQGSTQYDETRYDASVGPDPANATTAYDNMDDRAVVFYVGHGTYNECLLRYGVGQGTIRGQTYQGQPNDPEHEIYNLDQMPDTVNFPGQHDMKRCLFGLFESCDSAATSPQSGLNLLQGALDSGADYAAGFTDTIWFDGYQEFSGVFWYYTMEFGLPIEGAALLAMENVRERHNGDYRGFDSWWATGNVTLKPARWGE